MSERYVLRRGTECYRVERSVVRGVIVDPTPTAVPGARDGALHGLVAWRGQVVPLAEPGDRSLGPARAAVIVQCDRGLLALAADDVEREDKAAAGALAAERIYQRLRDHVRNSG